MPREARDHTAGTATNTSAPNGNRKASGEARRTSRAELTMARMTPPTVRAMPRSTAMVVSENGVTRAASATRAVHAGLVNASTRWPALKTGPCPARMFWTTCR